MCFHVIPLSRVFTRSPRCVSPSSAFEHSFRSFSTTCPLALFHPSFGSPESYSARNPARKRGSYATIALRWNGYAFATMFVGSPFDAQMSTSS